MTSKDNGNDNDYIKSNIFVVVVITVRAMYISNDNNDNNIA